MADGVFKVGLPGLQRLGQHSAGFILFSTAMGRAERAT
jgi:hypothetical protein